MVEPKEASSLTLVPFGARIDWIRRQKIILATNKMAVCHQISKDQQKQLDELAKTLANAKVRPSRVAPSKHGICPDQRKKVSQESMAPLF